MCFMYKGDSIMMYEHLYEGKELEEEEIKHLNNELLRANDYGKAKYAKGYKEQLLIKIKLITYIWMINIAMVSYLIYIREIEIYYLQEKMNNYSLALIILSVFTISWIYSNKSILKYLFGILSVIITLSWLIIIINHFVPLLYHEILVDNSYIKIVDNYTLKEKIYFIKEYLQYQAAKLNLDNRDYLLKMLENHFRHFLDISLRTDLGFAPWVPWRSEHVRKALK